MSKHKYIGLLVLFFIYVIVNSSPIISQRNKEEHNQSINKLNTWQFTNFTDWISNDIISLTLVQSDLTQGRIFFLLVTNNNELSSYQVSTIDGKIKNIPFSINDRKIFSNLTEEECNTIFDDKKGNLFMLFTTTTYNSEETTHLLVILETKL